MTEVKVLGSGCSKCEVTARMIEDVAKSKGVEIRMEKVTDMVKIASTGVMSTPAVMLNGKVVHSGGIPDRQKIESWLA